MVIWNSGLSENGLQPSDEVVLVVMSRYSSFEHWKIVESNTAW